MEHTANYSKRANKFRLCLSETTRSTTSKLNAFYYGESSQSTFRAPYFVDQMMNVVTRTLTNHLVSLLILSYCYNPFRRDVFFSDVTTIS